MKFVKGLSATLTIGMSLLILTASNGLADQIRLGMTPEPYMPFTQINKAGVWEGFEADLTNALCEKMGSDCKISQMAWEGLIPSLTAEKVDFIVGAFSITDKRREVVDFSMSYYNAATVMVGMKGDKTKITDKPAPDGKGMVVERKSISRKTIGVQNASIQDAYAKKYLADVDAKSYPTADNAIADLTAGRIDYVIMDLQYIKTFLESKDGGDYEVKHTIPSNVILGEGIAYAVRKGDKKHLKMIDKALSELREDGSLDSMVQKWFFQIQ